MLVRYQSFQRPDLSPATSRTAFRSGSKTNKILTSVRPVDPGRSSFMLFLHVVPGAALDPVNHRLPERRPLRCEQVDCCGDEFDGRAVETQEPLADLVEQHHLSHARTL